MVSGRFWLGSVVSGRFGWFGWFQVLSITIIYNKYLAHNLGSATEMIINITLADDFLTSNISNCKNYLHLSIKLQFNNRNIIYQNKVYWEEACPQALASASLERSYFILNTPSNNALQQRLVFVVKQMDIDKNSQAAVGSMTEHHHS